MVIGTTGRPWDPTPSTAPRHGDSAADPTRLGRRGERSPAPHLDTGRRAPCPPRDTAGQSLRPPPPCRIAAAPTTSGQGVIRECPHRPPCGGSDGVAAAPTTARSGPASRVLRPPPSDWRSGCCSARSGRGRSARGSVPPGRRSRSPLRMGRYPSSVGQSSPRRRPTVGQLVLLRLQAATAALAFWQLRDPGILHIFIVVTSVTCWPATANDPRPVISITISVSRAAVPEFATAGRAGMVRQPGRRPRLLPPRHSRANLGLCIFARPGWVSPGAAL